MPDHHHAQEESPQVYFVDDCIDPVQALEGGIISVAAPISQGDSILCITRKFAQQLAGVAVPGVHLMLERQCITSVQQSPVQPGVMLRQNTQRQAYV